MFGGYVTSDYPQVWPALIPLQLLFVLLHLPAAASILLCTATSMSITRYIVITYLSPPVRRLVKSMRGRIYSTCQNCMGSLEHSSTGGYGGKIGKPGRISIHKIKVVVMPT